MERSKVRWFSNPIPKAWFASPSKDIVTTTWGRTRPIDLPSDCKLATTSISARSKITRRTDIRQCLHGLESFKTCILFFFKKKKSILIETKPTWLWDVGTIRPKISVPSIETFLLEVSILGGNGFRIPFGFQRSKRSAFTLHGTSATGGGIDPKPNGHWNRYETKESEKDVLALRGSKERDRSNLGSRRSHPLVERKEEVSEPLCRMVPMKLECLFDQQPVLPKKRKSTTGIDLTDDDEEEEEDQARSILKKDRMKVFLRIKPLDSREEGEFPCLIPDSDEEVLVRPPSNSLAQRNGEGTRKFKFTHVLGPDVEQRKVFECVAESLVRDVASGKSKGGALLCYGVTAAGKTYTMQGTKEYPGIIPHAMECLFDNLPHDKNGLQVLLSYFEVYQDTVVDLLALSSKEGRGKDLKLLQDGEGHVTVAGVSHCPADCAEEALSVWLRAAKARQRARTALNASSSRSHAVFNVTVSDKGVVLANLSFVDLAGSERASRTKHTGLRLKESIAINHGLMTLGRCLQILRWNQEHPQKEKVVPYRESKITRVLKGALSLENNQMVILIANVGSDRENFDETLRALRYASIASQLRAPVVNNAQKAITTKQCAETQFCSASKVQRVEMEVANCEEDCNTDEEQEVEYDTSELLEEIANLRAQLYASEHRAAEMETQIREEVTTEMQELLQEMEENYKEKLKAQSRGPGRRRKTRCTKRDDGVLAGSRVSSPLANLLMKHDSSKKELLALREKVAKLHTLVQSLEMENSQLKSELRDSRMLAAGADKILQETLEEEKLQLDANHNMELETIEHQLERKNQECHMLRWKLMQLVKGDSSGNIMLGKQGLFQQSVVERLDATVPCVDGDSLHESDLHCLHPGDAVHPTGIVLLKHQKATLQTSACKDIPPETLAALPMENSTLHYHSQNQLSATTESRLKSSEDLSASGLTMEDDATMTQGPEAEIHAGKENSAIMSNKELQMRREHGKSKEAHQTPVARRTRSQRRV